MSDVLAIFGPVDTDSDLLTELERLRPERVTVLLDGGEDDWASAETPAAAALRDRLAALLALVERRTGATVFGVAGDRRRLAGQRFDHELGKRQLVAA